MKPLSGKPASSQVRAELRALISGWGATWGLPDLERIVSVTFSSRLTTSLGRCRPSTGRVSLRADLQHTEDTRLAEVLCHEVAHVAAFHLFGREAAPHGPEWRHLVFSAGFQPRAKTTEFTPDLGSGARRNTTDHPLRYEHRCPVCQSVRYARRSVGRWRCAECLVAGLGGELVITKHPHPESPS